MRRGLRLPLIALGVVVVPAAVAVAWVGAQRLRDPMTALRRDPGAVRLVRDSAYEGVTGSGERRIFRDLMYETEGAGTLHLTTSRPAEAPAEPLPLVMILAGLRTGRESLAVVERHGPNLLVGYEYPYDQDTWYQSARLTQVPAIRRAVLNVPWQVAWAAERLAEDPSVDGGRRALLGYSFGAMFVPATQRLAAEVDRPFDAAILAFGGADIHGLLEANLRVRPDALRRGLAWLAASLLHPMEPEHHLPHLTGRFLVIRGAADRQVPAALSARLAEATPEPKLVLTLDAGHMNPRNPALTARVTRLSQAWLVGQGVLEGVPDPAPGPSWAPGGSDLDEDLLGVEDPHQTDPEQDEGDGEGE